MAIEVKVPTTGNAGEPAVILEWNVAVGDAVAAGDVVATLETAKATVEVDAPEGGIVLDIRFDEGDEAPEHDVLFVLGAAGEVIEKPVTDGGQQPASPTEGDVIPASDVEARQEDAAPRRTGSRISISPRARRLAHERGLDVSELVGTGPFGRVVITDVEAADAAGPAGLASATPSAPATAPTAAPVTTREGRRIPVRGARKITAQRMHASLQNTAQVTLTRYANADALLAYAGRLKESAARHGTDRVGVNDLLLFAVARTLARHPAANSWFDWDEIVQFDHVDLGFAVDTGQALLVPVIRDAHTLTLGELASQAHAAIDRARGGRTSPEEMAGGTFTVSNLGSAGIHWFTPVLNSPQSGILGIGATHRATPDAAAQLPLSLTFDHRAIDGAAAAALLSDFATSIEYIDTLTAH